jgi:23S rRNA (adenine2503-C2)-methyltransferase
VYSEWYRKGSVSSEEGWIEPQARALVAQILELTDFSLPELALTKIEGGLTKFLLRYPDRVESESVLIPMQAGNTLCISSQIGCQMGCGFCETGRMGLLRNLNPQEITAQVFYARLILKVPVRNIVFMGMGEPLDNYENVLAAVKVLTDPTGFAFGPSNITISTSGVVDKILKLIDDVDPALNLAVSVNASNDAVRTKVMPVNRKWNMAALKEAMQAYCRHPRRKILAEYVMMQGINDQIEHAYELADYLQGLPVKINLIPYNAQSNPRYQPSSPEQIDSFMRVLKEKGYQVWLRNPKGKGIMAACGQLGNKELRLKIYRT